jgi:hypothetical protein
MPRVCLRAFIDEGMLAVLPAPPAALMARPRLEPTEEQRHIVRMLRASGTTVEIITTVVTARGIDPLRSLSLMIRHQSLEKRLTRGARSGSSGAAGFSASGRGRASRH